MFKVQPRANSNCLTDGPVYLFALKQLAVKFWHQRLRVSEAEQFAFENVYIGSMHKCMLQDTITGTSMLNLGVFIIDGLKPETAEYFD
mmetsp:Transcript_36804/g.48319  ORF Transcript_36804/g.48319 Transcript_36804/m.48319 type:complete len:88 (+) Transcript_36804:402-665(+)